ncbi:sensor histidine kinase, partial [Streptomyces palmae]
MATLRRAAGPPPPRAAGSRSRPAIRWARLIVPVLLAVADALLVNGVTLDLELDVALLAAAVLLLRRRFPVLVFLATLPGILIGYVWFAPMIAMYTVASVRGANRLVLALCAPLLAAAHFVPWPVSDLDPTAYRDNTLTLIDSCVTSVGPIALGLLVRTRRELAARLDELTRSRRDADRLLAERVVGTERARLAREMHDVVAHQVSLISLQAGAIQISTQDPQARESARTIRDLSVRTLNELRHMVGILRKAGGDTAELTPQPRLADLPRLIEMSALDVTYEADFTPEGAEPPGGTEPYGASGSPGRPAPPEAPASPSASAPPGASKAPEAGESSHPREAAEPFGPVVGTDCPARPEAVERAAFRTVQEALTNVRKHAPGARVRVRVSEHDPACPGLRVEIRNGPPDADASAPELPGGGHGLVGLRERAQLLGGTLDAYPTEGGGFVVRACFPHPTGRQPRP